MSGTARIDGDNLVLELHGIDRILAIKRSITIPLKHVVSASSERVDWKPFQQLRIGGTGIPGVVKDGRFLTPEGWTFFEMHDPNECVTITLNDEVYKKIVFQVEDNQLVAMTINDAVTAMAEDSTTESAP
jgi:hypothetical protein